MKVKIIISAIAVLFACCAAIVFIQSRPNATAMTANIYLDGNLIRSVDLMNVPQPYTFEIEDGHGGTNIISVERGRVCVTEANCSDRVCVKRGWNSGGATPIVCLPHKLVIEVIGGDTAFDVAAL